MVKKIKYVFLLTIVFAMGLCTHSFARITTNDPTVNSGDTVTITISSQEPVASGAITISSNDGLIFKSAAGGTVNGNMVAFSKANNVTSGIATYTFTAPEVSEDKTYKVVFASQDMADEEGNVVASSSATATVKVKAKNVTPKPDPEPTPDPEPEPTPDPEPEPPTPTKATITKLVVAGKTYNRPAQDITLKVENEIEEAEIEVTTSNGESYTIDKGNKVKLAEGTNMVTITLASGNVYTVRIRREAKVDETPNIIDEPEQPVKVTLKSLVIKGIASEGEPIELSYTPEFSSEVYEYRMLLDETLSNITKLNIEALGAQDDFTVEITGNEELKDGENTITILVKSKDGKTTATYTIIVTKEAKVIQTSTPTVEVEPEVSNPVWTQTQKIIIAVIAAIVAIMGIVFAIIEYKHTKKNKEDEEEVNEDETLNNVYSEINPVAEEEEDKVGEIPFARIDFENEMNHVNMQKEEKEAEFQILEESNDEIEELRKQAKNKKGKHF